MTTTTDAIQRINAANKPEDLFLSADVDHPKRTYRRLARIVHPDVNHANAAATDAFARLIRLWNEFNGNTPTVVPKSLVLRTKKHEYTLGELLYKGDIANIYTAASDVGHVLVKMPRDPRNNDLMAREVSALKLLAAGDDRWKMFTSRYIESFKHRDSSHVDRTVVIMPQLDGLRSLIEVKEQYPAGVHWKDMAWMFRRLLIALGFAHDAGVIHGAVLPNHVLIHAEGHGLVLVDWCYSVKYDSDEHVPALVPDWKPLYPAEIINKEHPGTYSDFHMAAETMLYITDPALPRQIKAFFNAMMLKSTRSRPQNAWALLTDFDALIERIDGPRRFRPFYMTPRSN